MSGGVDSSVAAHLLSLSHPIDDLVGIHMSNWDYHNEGPTMTTSTRIDANFNAFTSSGNNGPSRCWEQDWKDARAAAQHLNIPIHHVSFEADYWNDVFEPYCEQLAQSVTPNPDVDCNRYIKFGVLKEYVRTRFHIDRLATGHYARLWDRSGNANHNDDSGSVTVGNTRNRLDMPDCLEGALEEEESSILADYLLSNTQGTSNVPILLTARDRFKDQSYFLSGVSGQSFSNILFPLGDLYKTPPVPNVVHDDTIYSSTWSLSGQSRSSLQLSVRELAQEARLPNASKRDSMGICFVGKRKHGDFINDFVNAHQTDPLLSSSVASTVATTGQPTTRRLHECINVEDGSVVATFDPLTNPSLTYATIGQGARLSGASQKWFVVDKRGHQLWICPGTHHPALYSDRLYVRNFNWIMGGCSPSLPFRAKCRIRHLQPLVECEIICLDNPIGNDGAMYEIRLEFPLRGIARGQVCAIYSGGRSGDLVCLGGGPIELRGPTYWEMQKDLPRILHPAGHNDLSLTIL
jgi:tRNA U34 2-thiouridine synthase MnmA/TrmU